MSVIPMRCILGAGLIWLTAVGCGSAVVEPLHPVTLHPDRTLRRDPSQLVEDLRSEETEEAPQAAAPDLEAPPEARPTAPVRAETIEATTPDNDGDEVSLVELARRERQRRAQTDQSRVVIDDSSLVRRGELPETTVSGMPVRTAPEASVPVESASAAAANGGPSSDDLETYWRGRVRELRYEWADLVEEKDQLVRDVNRLRRDFYEEDDPYYRDAEIKPDWDRAWNQLQQVRRDIEIVVEELDATLEEGRTAGALPGWLREGLEVEPEPVEEDPGPDGAEPNSLGTVEPVEPSQARRGTGDAAR